MPLLDLRKQYDKIRNEIKVALESVLESQYFILGPKVEELEKEVAAYCGCKYALGVSSGTDALVISLMAASIGPGDVVITTPYTFFATVGAIVRVGARPLFVDIDERTYNMDPKKLEQTIASLQESERGKVKAIMPIHLYGQCADMGPLLEQAKAYSMIVIEDAAQAIGAEYQFGDGTLMRAGTMGDFGCFSFFPSKNLGAFGDGGMVTTNSEEIYERLKIMRVHGSMPKYYHKVVGGNFRLDALQAAVLSVKLKHLDEWTDGRNKNAQRYRELFRSAGLPGIALPVEREKKHIYNQFVISLTEGRDDLKKYLNDNGIGSEIYYPVPLHLQECFKGLKYHEGDFPVSEKAAASTLALPIFPELTDMQQKYVVDMIGKYFEEH